MSDKCSGCGYYTSCCQCKIDDNYCRCCHRIISDCRCSDHNDHYRYPKDSKTCGGDDACSII